jgi:hypothetical protein
VAPPVIFPNQRNVSLFWCALTRSNALLMLSIGTIRRVRVFSGISRPQGRCEWYRDESGDVHSVANLFRIHTRLEVARKMTLKAIGKDVPQPPPPVSSNPASRELNTEPVLEDLRVVMCEHRFAGTSLIFSVLGSTSCAIFPT